MRAGVRGWGVPHVRHPSAAGRPRVTGGPGPHPAGLGLHTAAPTVARAESRSCDGNFSLPDVHLAYSRGASPVRVRGQVDVHSGVLAVISTQNIRRLTAHIWTSGLLTVMVHDKQTCARSRDGCCGEHSAAPVCFFRTKTNARSRAGSGGPCCRQLQVIYHRCRLLGSRKFNPLCCIATRCAVQW